MRRKWIAGAAVCTAAVLGIFATAGVQKEKVKETSVEKEIQTYSDTDFAMGTVVMETMYTTGENRNSSVGETLREIEETLLSWTNQNSQVSRLNQAGGAPTEVSPQISDYLETILQLSKDSEGAFDPTLGEIIRLWNIGGENPQIPTEEELEKLLQKSGENYRNDFESWRKQCDGLWTEAGSVAVESRSDGSERCGG